MSLKIIHDLSKLLPEEEIQYLREVSAFIGLDPDLNGLDTIWMPNESGPGNSKVVYARRGTAEILREVYGIEVSTLTHEITPESAVFTATGKNKAKRQEIAIGSKSLRGLNGRAYDNAIMTASTRALRRLTMQFTKLGILDESEIEGMKAETTSNNPAAGATLAGSPIVMPPMPAVQPNNAPGKPVEPPAGVSNAAPAGTPLTINTPAPAASVSLGVPFVGQQDQIDAAWKQQADKKVDTAPVASTVTSVEPATSTESVTDTKADAAPSRPKRTRKPKNSVNMGDVEPEVVNKGAGTVVTPATVALQSSAIPAPPPQASVAESVPAAPVAPVAAPSTDFEGKPTDAQMGEYRKKVSVYTAELPSSENLGSVQKMRAFITRMSGTAPQFMTVDQWQEMISWFEQFVETNKTKGLVKYINDTLGVK